MGGRRIRPWLFRALGRCAAAWAATVAAWPATAVAAWPATAVAA